MRLKKARIERFHNVVDRQDIDIDDDVTCFVGKNESGKTTILQALHRLNPANLRDSRFDQTTEYPRWRLARDRRLEDLAKFRPVEALFTLSDRDYDACAHFLPARPPKGTICTCAKSYDNTGYLGLVCSRDTVFRTAAAISGLTPLDTDRVLGADSREAAAAMAREAARALREQGDESRAKSLATFPMVLDSYGYLLGDGLTPDQRSMLVHLLPKFFYFSEYELLPGERDLHLLADKAESGSALDSEDESVLALLAYADAHPRDFLGDNYDQRKVELQAAALDLTHKVFSYWSQNSDLEVEFDTELEEVGRLADGAPVNHRMLKVLMRDNRHGGIVTNFESRSAGFRWFFSFLAAFSRFQELRQSVIVLLDEPAMNLHGAAQQDILRFITNELGRSQQVLYTTHSQHMVDASRYETLRAVDDMATRDDPDLGVAVRPLSDIVAHDAMLPLQAALAQSISAQLLQEGGRMLIVERGADVDHLRRLSMHLERLGLPHLDPRFRIIPVGSTANMPSFIAVNGRSIDVTLLLTGERGSSDAQRLSRLADGGHIRDDDVVVLADVCNGVAAPGIEDVFSTRDYVRLFNLAFEKLIHIDAMANNSDGIVSRITALNGPFDRRRPARALHANEADFFADIDDDTIDRFAKLFATLNATFADGLVRVTGTPARLAPATAAG